MLSITVTLFLAFSQKDFIFFLAPIWYFSKRGKESIELSERAYRGSRQGDIQGHGATICKIGPWPTTVMTLFLCWSFELCHSHGRTPESSLCADVLELACSPLSFQWAPQPVVFRLHMPLLCSNKPNKRSSEMAIFPLPAPKTLSHVGACLLPQGTQLEE